MNTKLIQTIRTGKLLVALIFVEGTFLITIDLETELIELTVTTTLQESAAFKIIFNVFFTLILV